MLPSSLPILLMLLPLALLVIPCVDAYWRHLERQDRARLRAQLLERAAQKDLDAPMASDTAIDAALATPLEFTLDGEPVSAPDAALCDWYAEGGLD